MSFHFPVEGESPIKKGDKKRGSVAAEFISLKQFEQRRMSLSLVSNNDLDERRNDDDQPERSASPEIQTRSTTTTGTQDTARSTAQVTFEDEAPADRSYRFPAQVVKIPGFLRFPGNAVRSQKLTNMIRQRLSVSGLQLGPQIGQRPPPSAASMSTALRAGLWLEQGGAGIASGETTENSAVAPIPPPPSFTSPPAPPSGTYTSPNASTNAPLIPAPPPPPSGTFSMVHTIPTAPGSSTTTGVPGVPPPPPPPPPPPLPSVGLSSFPSPPAPPSTTVVAKSVTAFPPLPPNPPEELNTNPFTAAYRNFPESSLKEVYIFLHEIGREIEQFAYKVLVEQHYHLSENGGDGETSHSGLTSQTHRSSSSFQKGRGGKTNYFSMAPRISVVQPFAEQLSTASATSAGGFIYNSHSCSDVFFGGGGHSKSIDSMRSGFDDTTDDEEDEKDESGVKPTKDDMDDFPHCVENNYFLYTDDWFDEFPLPCPIVEAKVAATTEPPIFFAGMLMDPVSEKFLFSGTTFYEEARVLKVGISKNDASPKESGIITWFNQQPRMESTPKTFAKILLREYISMCREHEGFIVQTFSILDSDVRIDARRNQLVAPSVLPKLLDRLQPGAITRAFSLQHVITLKSLQDEALADMRPSAIPDIPRFPTTIKKDESFRNTSLFTSNIVRRYTIHGHQNTERKNQTTTALWLKRRFRRDNAVSSDHYAFLSDENPMRPLFETEMQQNAPMYVKPIDNIKAFLIFFKDTFSFYAMVRVLFAAVKCLQRFFRYCLGKKRRALARMLRLWRHLESECRLKLQHYHPAPSSAERIDMIAANVLQPYMITTREYKESLIQELWKARHIGYQKWCRDRAVDAHIRTAGATVLSPAYRNVIPQLPSPEIRGVVSFVEVEPALERAMEELHPDGGFGRDSLGSGNPLRAGNSRQNNNVTPIVTHVFNAVESSRKHRLEDEVHQLFGWYIEPEKLLYESHHRLLTSLKESVLSMEEVQMEMQNLSVERAERRGAIINPDDLRAFAATP